MTVLPKVCGVIRDLLNYDATKIRIAQTNTSLKFNEDTFFIVDSLSSTMVGNGRSWDAVSQKMTYGTTFVTAVTVDVMGKEAMTYTSKLINLLNSHKLHEVSDNTFQIYAIKQAQRLPVLDGKTYERYQIEFNVSHLESLAIDTNRIDIIQDINTLIEE